MASPQRVHIGGTPVDLCSQQEFVDLITYWACEGRRATVVGINAHVVNMCARDAAFAAAVAGADLNFPDGQSVVWAAALLGYRPQGRVPLTHLTGAMCGAWAGADLPVYLLGSRPGVAARAAGRLHIEHGLRVVGVHDGYFDESGERELIAEINRSGAAILLVGLGNPRQEVWLARHRADLAPAVALTCGGWLDWTAGERRSCPRWIYRFGLEWAYRLAQEPRRLFTRYVLGNPRFLYRVVRAGTGDGHQ